MVQKRRGYGPWLAAAVVLAVFGCSGPQPTAGSVQLIAMLQGATAAEVTRVRVTVTATDMDPLTSDLTQTGSTWGGTIGPLPAGSGRTFTAEAFNTAGTQIFSGKASDITITAGQTAVVNITLQQLDLPPDFENGAPIISSLSASTDLVQPGGSVLLSSWVQDSDAGDTISYAWTSTAGSFDAPTSASTSWTAPMTPGPVTLTLTVTDSKGASASLSLTLTVEGETTGGSTGSATVGALFNAWPQVTRITASPSFLSVGDTTTVEALASDLDGDPLAYQWTLADGCTGSLTNASSSTVSVTITGPLDPLANPHSCYMNVTVTDGRGGQGKGALRFYLGPKASAAFPPRVTSTSQSATTVNTGETVTFSVTAVDPQASPLSFQWQSGDGTLGTPVSGFATSEITWTAPSCVPASLPTVGVAARVSNTRFLSAFAPLSVTLTGPACPTPAWMNTGTLVSSRRSHTATVLSSGKVLVAGGGDGAELYDPALRLWQPVSYLIAYRSSHAAVLLPSGKVLVTGGQSSGSQGLASAELYDPNTQRWTAVAPMLQGRYGHAATVLPSGKVLVTGGISSTGDLSSAELYDPATDTWTATGSMSQLRTEHSMLLLPSGKVLVAGRSNSSSNQVELYDPDTGAWTTAPLLRSRTNAKAVLLNSGTVLVVGQEAISFTAEVFNPTTGTSTATGNPASNHLGVDPVVLPSGRVLLAGGGSNPFSGGSAAELYDPLTGTWSTTGSLSVPRARHTVSLLPSGVVLIAGGQSSNNPAGLDSAELYLP
ncbi:MAG: PKD domain-containing protein [Myxococcaceae bacterium]|nr:PKD domain-containing protein [Myxococcaceae bacterium]